MRYSTSRMRDVVRSSDEGGHSEGAAREVDRANNEKEAFSSFYVVRETRNEMDTFLHFGTATQGRCSSWTLLTASSKNSFCIWLGKNSVFRCWTPPEIIETLLYGPESRTRSLLSFASSARTDGRAITGRDFFLCTVDCYLLSPIKHPQIARGEDEHVSSRQVAQRGSSVGYM